MAETFFREEAIQPMLDAMGVSVTVGATTAKALWNTVDDEQVRDEVGTVTGRVYEAIAKTGTFAGLQQGATLVRDSVNYTVIQARRIEDGALTRALCTPS